MPGGSMSGAGTNLTGFGTPTPPSSAAPQPPSLGGIGGGGGGGNNAAAAPHHSIGLDGIENLDAALDYPSLMLGAEGSFDDLIDGLGLPSGGHNSSDHDLGGGGPATAAGAGVTAGGSRTGGVLGLELDFKSMPKNFSFTDLKDFDLQALGEGDSTCRP